MESNKKFLNKFLSILMACMLILNVPMSALASDTGSVETEPAVAAEVSTEAVTENVTEVPATEAPVTEAPATEAPITEAPATEAPVTEAPVTEAPVTEAPVTEAPVTEAPATEAPVTEAPVTEAPATETLVTEVPVTEAPATEIPVTESEKSEAPTLNNTEDEIVAVTGITLDQTEAKVAIGGDSLTLTAEVTPENATDKTVTWSSSDAAIAAVDEKGVVTAVAEGTATITAKAGDVSAECTVTVIKPADPAEMEVTIADQGNLVMIREKITVTDYDDDGSLDVDDALYAAHNHEKGYSGGAAEGYLSYVHEEYGLSCGKLWGDTSGNFGYVVNDKPSNGLADEVKAGDELTAYIYKDQSGWSDAYARFGAEEYTTTAGTALAVTVEEGNWDSSYTTYSFAAVEDAVLTAYDSDRNVLSTEKYTVEGYNVTFKEAGTYYLAAAGTESNVLVPAVVKVTVEEKQEEQKMYLSSLRIKARSGEKETEILQTDIYEYEFTLPADCTNLYLGAALSEDAPQGSKITAKYYFYTFGRDWTSSISSETSGTHYLSGAAPKGGETASVIVSVGIEGDVQEYKITMPRSAVIGSVSFAEEDGTTLKLVDGVYYAPADSTGSLSVTANVYGANLTVNGETAADNTAYAFTPQYDTNNKFEVTVAAGYSEADKLSNTYTIKKLTEGEAITGSCGTDVKWSLSDDVLTISGTGAMTDYTTSSKPAWNVFAGSIQSVVIEEGVTGIGNYTFNGGYSALGSVTLPDSLTSIGRNAFASCTALKSLVIPKTVTTIGTQAFSDCTALENITIGALEKYVFNNCAALKTVTWNGSVTSVPQFAFNNCTALESIVIPEGVTEIANNAFYGCKALKSVELPASLTSFSGYSFKQCPALESITVSGQNYTVKEKIVYSADGKTLVLCPPTYEGSVVVPEGVTKISDAAFFYCTKLTGVTLPDGITSLGEDVFCGCSALKKVVMPDSVTEIAPYTFQFCSALEEVVLSANLTSITNYMFDGCSSLKSVTIPEKVTTIGNNAFQKCTALESVTIPKSVTTLGNYMFTHCTALKECEIPESVTAIPNGMFNGCSALETVIIPASVTSITRGSFGGTTASLKYVLFRGSFEQWDAITGTKPEAPTWSTIVLCHYNSIGDLEKDAPVITEQPKDQVFKENADAENALQVKVEEATEEGTFYYFNWYSNTEKSTKGGIRQVSTSGENGISTSYTPATDTAGNMYYYCMVVKVNAEGTVTYTYSDVATVAVTMDHFTGSGTETSPYLINNQDELVKLHDLLEEGLDVAGMYFQLTDNITLPDNWTPMGSTKATAFTGILDGNNKTVTVPSGGLPLLGNVKNAQVRNLNIYGEKIAGHGLVNNFEGVGLSGSAIIIDNVTLKSGSSTLKSGLIGANITTNGFAGCSNGFVATVRNCTIEEGVVIGYNKDQSMIGSIAGRMQGTVENCVSYATVYGNNYVGGIIGTRDNAMGTCKVTGCTFNGTVEASGVHVGGIVGGGYSNSTAPNGVRIPINNCSSAGNITGADKVGGILGGDSFVAQSWGAYSFKGNSFTGKVKATEGTNVGGIIGFYDSLNKTDDISNNYYADTCGATKGIGTVVYVDTNCTTHETESGAVYFSTEGGTSGCPTVAGCGWKADYNRTDDPLGADADKLASTTLSTEPYVETLTVSGEYKTEYYIGEEFDFTGMVLTAVYSDGTQKVLNAEDITVIGYDNTTRGNQTVTLEYSGAKAEIEIKVLYRPVSNNIEVTFTLLADSVHDSVADGDVHTLTAGNLTEWVPVTSYEVDLNATAYDVMQAAAEDYGFVIGADEETRYGVYIEYIEYKGVKLEEFDNGPNSGWMYTVNGEHPDVGVAAKYLEDGDVIVFHYTDDYTKEHDWSKDWSSDENAHWHECLDDSCVLENNAEKGSYAAHTFGDWVEETANSKYKTCTVCGYVVREEVSAETEHTHSFGKWSTVSEATVKAAEVQKRTCSICGESETQTVGKKLTPVLEVPGKLKSIKLKKGEKYTVSLTMAKGDKISSVKSKNSKIVKVSSSKKKGTITLKAVKTGSTKVTIKLSSGKKRTYTVKVVKGTVKTSKVSLSSTKLTLTKGRSKTLKPILTPFSSTQKITYKSSNKKIATVTSKGKVKAIAPGTAKITIKSGTKKVTCKVTVPGIANVKSSLTIKKGKTATLTAKTYGVSGKVTYTSSDKKVATVSSKGKIKAVKKGTATITVKAGKYKVKCKVTVK